MDHNSQPYTVTDSAKLYIPRPQLISMYYTPFFMFVIFLVVYRLFTGITTTTMAVIRQPSNRVGRSQLLKNDRLGELPDDIIIHILSFLTLKEAGRTSVLSKRWRHRWAYIPTLNFDSSMLIDEFERNLKSPKVETPRYMNWVDQVVNSYKGPTIDEFRVRYDMRYLENSSHSIDNFIRFALEKKVKRLEVDLSCYTGGCQRLRHSFNCLSFCNSLTSLELGCINITGEMLESVLCNCQTLEYLSVNRSSTLLNLKVTGRSLSLKTLRICSCKNIKQLEISAPNLVSVCYFGPEINMDFKSGMLKLSEVSVGYDYAVDLVKGFSDLSGYISQIEALSLSPTPFKRFMDVRISFEGTVCTRLRKLVMTTHSKWDDDLCFLELMLKACPVLHHFELQLTLDEMEDDKERDGLKHLEASPHYNLKVVEIVGFLGFPVDLEIAVFLIESAVSLEKITLDPRCVLLIDTIFEFQETPEKAHAREHARHLHTKLKPDTELKIL